MRQHHVRNFGLAVISAAVLVGCGHSASQQSVGATTPTTRAPQSPPGWAPDSFAATPTDLTLGQNITFTGTGCGPDGHVQVFGPGSVLNANAGADGSWSATGVIPDNSPVGDNVPAYADCIVEQHVFKYTPLRLRVTTDRHLEVEPGTLVHPGDTLTVTAVGSCGVGDGFSMSVGLRKEDGGSLPGYTDQFLTRGPDGVWSGPYVVPTVALPGSYDLVGTCQDRGSSVGFNPVRITVLAAGVSTPQPASTGNGNAIPETH